MILDQLVNCLLTMTDWLYTDRATKLQRLAHGRLQHVLPGGTSLLSEVCVTVSSVATDFCSCKVTLNSTAQEKLHLGLVVSYINSYETLLKFPRKHLRWLPF